MEMQTKERLENPVKIACVQMDIRSRDKDYNLDHASQLIQAACRNNAGLIILPELFSTGSYFDNRQDAYSYGESIPEGPTAAMLTELACRHNVYLAASFIERDKSSLYNTAVLAGPGGLVGKYRKLHLCGDEIYWLEPGNLGLPVFQTPIGRISMLICLDGYYPETYRICALQKADIICIPTNWACSGLPAPYRTMGPVLSMANALSNHIFVAACTRVGEEPGLQYPGQSIIAGPTGSPVSGPAGDQEEILYAVCNLSDARKRYLNATNSRLGNRRTDVYGELLGYQPEKQACPQN